MINTQYGNSYNPVIPGQNVNMTDNVKNAPANAENTETAVSSNRDTFEHVTTETAATYSPETIGKGANSVNSVASTTSQATTDAQKRLIPEFLAAKMAGLTTDSSGSPHINSQSDYNAYVAAWGKIRGNHADLSTEQDKGKYWYSQTGYPYGNPEPEISCCTFAFATALSIKYKTQITPDKIETVVEGDKVRGYVDSGTSTQIWKAKVGGIEYKAYKIIGSSGDETLKGIDAQLQLGNPVLIHTKGDSVNDPNHSFDKQHWATVIGKQNGRYRIIDPWDGTDRWLEEMEIYSDNGFGLGTIEDYVILSDEY